MIDVAALDHLVQVFAGLSVAQRSTVVQTGIVLAQFQGAVGSPSQWHAVVVDEQAYICLLYTSDAADEEDSVDLGGRRIVPAMLAGL